MENEIDLKHKIHYFAREKYYQTMQDLALDAFKTYPEDLSFKLYSSFALVLCGRFQESIKELESLINLKDYNIGAILALIVAHKSFHNVNKEVLGQLDVKLKSERKIVSEYGLYFGALFLFFMNKIEKSKEYLEKHLKYNPGCIEGITLKGWIEISIGNTLKHKSAFSCFNTALDKEKRNMDAILGQVKLKEVDNDLEGAIFLLNELIVKYPNALPPLIEKMKVQLAFLDWDLTMEIASRILAIDSYCLEALRMKCLVSLVRDGNFDEAALNLRRLYTETEKSEGKNGKLFLFNAQLFSYLSGRNPKILTETVRFAEKAIKIEPSNVDFIIELGYQHLLQGKVKEAAKFFHNSTRIDDSSVTALTGLMLCQIQEGDTSEQVKQQVEFLREIQNDQPTAELWLMSAKLSQNVNDAIKFMNKAVDLHISSFKKYPYGVQYLYSLNPAFIMDLVHEYLKYSPSKLSVTSNIAHPSEQLKKCLKVLEEVTKACPGLVEAQYALAQMQFLTGNIKEARATASHILDDLDATSGETHILMAQIYMQEKNYQLGAQSLEVGLSYNFQIREHPLYHLIHAMVNKEKGNLDECINSLKSAIAACGSKTALKSNKGKYFNFELSLNDRITIYLELINIYQLNNQPEEISKLMEEAVQIFQGTVEEGRLTIAKAELSVSKGNVNHTIEELEKIRPDESHYILAKKTLANIYLNHKRDSESFIRCYKDIVEIQPSAETYIMLGDAFMSIQEPDASIEAYEEALKYNSGEFNLICKIGRALIKTHHFSKAINYYKDSVKNEKNLELLYDMAELYFKLGQLDNAERILVTEVENIKVSDVKDVNQISARTRLLCLLAKVRDKAGNLTESLAALKAAKENHNRIEKRILNISDEHKEIITNICTDMAVLLTRLRDFSGAIKCYKESLTLKPNDTKSLVSLCRLYLQTNDLEECQSMSERLLIADPENESAIVMLADLAFGKVDFETAGYHFKKLLSKSPTSWTALTRLIEVMRRTGNLEEVAPYLEKCETPLLQNNDMAGYSYCKGLFEWYSGRPTLAIRHFNRARRDPEWGQQAMYSMIEICLNPDNETLGSEAFLEGTDDEDMEDSKEMALKTAQRLLNELKQHQTSDESLRLRLLENFWLLATKQKHNVEKALQNLLSIASKDLYREHVGVSLGIATAYMLQKQVQKARNQLKRVVKSQWNFADAEYLERSWLLLTDIYIQSGKLELPTDLIQRILTHNKSCYKAYEYAGYIAEKEQLYKDAAIQYENAWRYDGQTNPAIGYKLAFNYLKGKKYADAIDVCNRILKFYPDYPRIQKDILEKARTNLRT